jgi:HK97 family phage prohead protease
MGKNMSKKTLTGYFKDYNKDTDLVRFTASSNSIDRDGEVLRADGWVLDNFKKNPVVLWSHDAKSLPIGRVTNAYSDEVSLITDIEFAVKENPLAKMVSDLVKGGFLNAVSVGFMPLSYDQEGKMLKQELLELSVVNVPANQDALRSNEYQAFCKSLKQLETKDAKVEEEAKPEEKIEVKPEEIVEEVKEGRIISEKNRNSMRIAIDSMKQASDTLTDLLNTTEPPAKKGEVKEVHSDNIRESQKRIYKNVRIVDHIVEAIIHDIKNGGEI